jgi:hypothetical protein
MPVVIRYNPSKSGIARCAVGPELRRAVDDVAHLAKAYAEGIAPDGFEGYALKFEVLQEKMYGYPDHHPMTRVSAVLINQAKTAILVEVGNATVQSYAVLEHTLDWLTTLAVD